MNDFTIIADIMNRIKPGMLKVRNFIVDYNLPDGTAMHGPVQGLDIGYSDSEMVAALKQSIKKQHNGRVSSIVEVVGRFTLDELAVITEDRELGCGVEFRPLYYDAAEAERGK